MSKSAPFFPILIFLFAQIATAQTGQIAIPRIEQMPNLPAPLNIRDWRQVAARYDSFAYDLQKTGQYLPLVYLKTAGTNYPQNPTFGLHTYIGTNSPMGNEAINVLPSLVGATLVGADKRNQFGKNWLLMSQDFFNKNNGENLYLNNAGASSGGDWWYDLMPNLYFYQLYDLYPNLGGEADAQFLTIADRFLEAVRTLGGDDAPWEPGYFNYRAFKFKTQQPNPVGVPEPEAAGAFAWVLFHAFQKTGNPEYLKAAEWSLEFLNDWQSNPSYELQLPYGTLTAAKMNAEIGTKYDIQKMLNWSFDRGALRGWGTIVGKWGGFDVSGLVGEANDAGNDYAFQLNGLQQAAALVPMVRYDKKFARAVGKWMLNLSNATRLFYPGFLPNNLQDAAAWSAANDPQQVVGYEALRQKWQNLSPFSTGDAVGGTWAKTNLSLYSTGSIGYLGALVEKTNVDNILKINLLKTDFYKNAAYPTFLFYNPNATAQLVNFDAGAAPADIYEALGETFILKNVAGTVSFQVPANQAILIAVCPAGGVVSFEKNKMKVNGTVVDFDQHAQIFTHSPRIKALAAAKNPLQISDTTTVFATVEDVDSDFSKLVFSWSSDFGNVSGTGATVKFHAPAAPQISKIQLISTDPEGNRDTAFLEITAVQKLNEAPQIIGFQKDRPFAVPSEIVNFTCFATDANGDALNFDWTFSGGTFSGNGNASVEWTAPPSEGIVEIKVKVSDDGGLVDEISAQILVKNFDPVPGNLVAHYPFSGNANDVSGNNLHGQANGAILTTDKNGVQQSAYYFNGGAQHIAVVNSPLLNFEDEITVSTWFKANALPEKETFLLSHGSWQNRWKISITPEKRLRWTLNSTNGIADLDIETVLETDKFYHVVATFDGSILAFYLDGELLAFKNLTGKIRPTTFPFLMGQMLPGLADYNFKGVLDAVKIFDFALAPDVVKILFGQGVVSAGEAVSGNFPQKNGLVLSPNPVLDFLKIEIPASGRVQIRDLAGRIILEKKSGGEVVRFDLNGFKSGVYVVFLVSAKGVFSGRFVKM